MKNSIDSIYKHIERLAKIDRVICSEEYDAALDYVFDNLELESSNKIIHEFAHGDEPWGWKLPESMNHWHDDRVEKKFYIPKRPMKVLSVLVPGVIKKEILFVSHLCHPAPAANDNASGAAMMIELANYYKNNPHHYTIRFLFTVEYWGTVSFLNRYEEILSNIVTVISLDMVGADQNICGSSMIVDEIPHHLTSNIDILLFYYLQNNGKTEKYRAIGNPVQTFTCDFQFYSGGSDHYIFNTAGIPSTCVNTYPDKFYHTAEDTIDKISKKTLELFFNTITQAINHFEENTDKDTQLLSQLILHRFQEMSSELILRCINTNFFDLNDFLFLINHIQNHCKSRINLLNISNDTNTKLTRSLNDEYKSALNNYFFLFNLNSEYFYTRNSNSVFYSKKFTGPLSRNKFFKLVNDDEKNRLQEWLSNDSLFFHKVDIAIEYSSSYNLKEISILLKYHYFGGEYIHIVKEFFDYLEKYGFLKKIEGND